MSLQGRDQEIWLRRTLRNSEVLSADVCAAFDPVFADAYEEQNSAKLGYGICLCKYTGARGKAGSNDANAEFMAKIRRIFNEKEVPWQVGELGKSTKVAVAPSPTSWPTGAATSSTAV